MSPTQLQPASSKKTVKIEPDHVEKPLRKLRKMLDTFPANPRPEEVHALRTHTRRLEATIAALANEHSKEPRRVLKLITPVRRAAGRVRDMDVLIEDVLTLEENQRGEGLVRLVEHLGSMRSKNAKKLRDAVSKRRRKTRTHLKELSKLLKERLKDESGTLNGDAAPQILVTELTHWPNLNADNLHMFRLRIKELRYMLELGDEPNAAWLDRLGNVKDSIGEWHDWVELLKIARNVLDPGPEAGILNRIDTITQEKFRTALTAANQMRKRIFDMPRNGRGNHRARPMPADS
jgi:CHAD domain-containing protein